MRRDAARSEPSCQSRGRGFKSRRARHSFNRLGGGVWAQTLLTCAGLVTTSRFEGVQGFEADRQETDGRVSVTGNQTTALRTRVLPRRSWPVLGAPPPPGEAT